MKLEVAENWFSHVKETNSHKSQKITLKTIMQLIETDWKFDPETSF